MWRHILRWFERATREQLRLKGQVTAILEKSDGTKLIVKGKDVITYVGFDAVRKGVSRPYGVVVDEAFTGDGTTTDFTLANSPVVNGSDAVRVDGVFQARDTDYSINYQTGVISFVTAPASGASILVNYTYVGQLKHIYVAIGSGTTAEAATDTALVTELARVLATYEEIESATGYKDKWKLTATFDPGVGTGTVTESGVFDWSSGGNMLCRQTFGAISKGAEDTLTMICEFTVSQV